ncbi:hypothetical protein IKE86_01015 [Candidatus Saccharibacteria bacterium]|nr:hypothetical protein [Candidatus Saccharibacteria bacterium]
MDVSLWESLMRRGRLRKTEKDESEEEGENVGGGAGEVVEEGGEANEGLF